MQLLKTKLSILVALGLSSVVISSNLQAQNFYKWVDKNGSTHYTLSPPPAYAKKITKVRTYYDQVSPSLVTAPQQTTPNTEAQNSARNTTTTTEIGQRITLPPPQDNVR